MLELEKTRISNEDDILFDCWLAQSKPAGTAKTNHAHWQLRSRKPQFGGKKSKYVKVADVGQYEAAIARGKQLKQLNQKITRFQQLLNQLETMI